MSATRIYAKNSCVVCREPEAERASRELTTAKDARGFDVAVPKGRAARGLILLHSDRVVTSKTCHEVEVMAVGPNVAPGLYVGDSVIVYLGGDDGGVSANGISAFLSVDGSDALVVQDRFIWAVVRDGEILPRRNVVLTQRDDDAFRRHARGAGALLVLPEANLAGGLDATGSADPTHGGDRTLAPVTALYERIVRVGPTAEPGAFVRGAVLCFSPSYCATKLRREVDGVTTWYHLVDSSEAYFVAE